MSTAIESVQPELASIVGVPNVAADAAQCAAYAVDGKVPAYVVYPSSAEQVAAVLNWAAERDLAVVPCRNCTKLDIGNPPRRYDIALSVKQLNNIWRYEPADLTVSVEPGVKFSDFQDFVGRHGLWLPLDPPGSAGASLGGILATNSAGPLRIRYGAPRDMVLGMTIATSDGKLIKTGGRVVKNVAGYDLSKLLIGSYGTLGVIVEANLKLYPKPIARATFVLRVDSMALVRELRRKILSSPLQPLRMIVLNSPAAVLVRSGPTMPRGTNTIEMWLEVGGSPKVIDRYRCEFESLARETGTILDRIPDSDAAGLWVQISDFRTCLASSFVAAIVKVSLRIPQCEEFLSRAQEQGKREGLCLAVLAQTGVGIAHVCLLDERPLTQLIGTLRGLRKAAEELGGVLVLEHCPVDVKAALDVWGNPRDDLDLLRKLKRVWDPKGVLAPGRFIGF